MANWIWLLALMFLEGCGVYSFTGTTLSPDIKTISFQQFYNDTDGGPPNMAQSFTDELRNYFQKNTNLAVIMDQGDLQFEGGIVGYDVSPVAPSAARDRNQADASELTRLRITVNAKYVNTIDDQWDFDRNFSFYSDFDNTQTTLTEVEDQLINTIFEQIIQDIFNASVANW